MSSFEADTIRLSVNQKAAARPAANADGSSAAQIPIHDHIVVEGNSVSVLLTTESILLVRCDRAGGTIAESGSVTELSAGMAALLIRPGTIAIAAIPGGRLHVVALRRAGVQMCAGTILGGARRLAPLPPILMTSDALTAAVDGALGTGEGLEQAIVAILADATDPDAAFPLVRSVTAAMRLVETQPERVWTTDSLATAAAVTAPVLRRAFRESLDTTVGQYVLAARFRHLRDRLQSGRETRSIAALAHDMEFGSASAFSRSYTRVFGESPSQTRAAAVAKM